ncbi:hypothetical protein G6F59_015655 [Rhizopus arrhizus]|nr:hypothetical protein G6F59_015655 [Rhizopus arrhizus]
MLDLAVFHPVAECAAGVIARDVDDALADQLGDKETRAQLLQHGFEIVAALGQRGAEHQVVRAAGVAGSSHAQLAGRVGRQEITFQHAGRHHVAAARAHALVVEGRAAHAATDVGVFGQVDVLGEDRLAQRVHQEAGLAVERPAVDGLGQRADQPQRQRRLEQDGKLAGADAAGRQAAQRALGS